MNATPGTVYTIGHSTRPLEELVALLGQSAVTQLIDVRAFPRSRTNPQFNKEVLAQSLGEVGVGYRHLASLGGRRHRGACAPPSPNTLWRSDPFRNYADYAMSEPFRDGLAELRRLADDHVCAIMCAEAVWWRCHRRIVADYLLAEGMDVRHIMGAAKIEPARLTPGALPQPDGTILYFGEPVGPLL